MFEKRDAALPASPGALEILNRPLMLFGHLERAERTQVLPAPCPGILLPRIEAVAVFQLSDHRIPIRGITVLRQSW
jgi:hypothetical protein